MCFLMNKLIAFFFIFFLSIHCVGQAPVLNFTHITDDQGLSNTSVEVIFQDSRGFIWFGTRDGLNRFDGYSIQIYRHDATQAYSLSNNYIKCIYEDQQHRLWIGTSKGLNYFDQEHQQFIHFLDKTEINALCEDTHENLLVATAKEGLGWLDETKKTLNSVSFLPVKSVLQVFDFAKDKQQNLWMATNKGLLALNEKTKKIRLVPSTELYQLVIDAQQHIWAASHSEGLLSFDNQRNSFVSFRHNDNNPTSLGSDNVTSLWIDAQQKLWVGCLNGGLNLYNPIEKNFHNYEREPEKPRSLSQKSVQSILEDKQGNLWVGTLRGGVNLYIPEAEKFQLYRQGLDKNSLSYNDIRAFCEDTKGNIWVGADGGGLNLFNRKTGKFSHYRHQPSGPSSIGSDAIMSITEDRKGNLWIATYGGGLNLFQAASGRFKRFVNKPNDPTSISSNFVQKAFEDSKGNFWVATYGGGLNRLDRTSQTFSRIEKDAQNQTRFTGKKIIAINEDKDQNVWICTEDGGLNRYDLRTNKFSHYFNEEGVEQDLVVIFTDHKKRLWIGKKGLYLFDKQRNRFEPFKDKAGFSKEFIKGIVEDSKGNLWITSSNGLTRFNPETQQYKKFNTRDGLQGLEFEDNSCLSTKDGQLFFGGVNGFNCFYPDKIRGNRFVPAVFVTDFQVSNKSVNPHDEDSPLEKEISFTDEIHLRYDQATFSFSFSALNYVVSENNQYAYRLDGLEDAWITAGTERKANYTNVQPGEYTFMVKATNNDGVWNDQVRTIKVIISPPFWATWWFRLLALGALAYAIFAFFEFRRNLELKAFEEKKKNELFQLQLQFFTNISHEFRTPLSLILGPLERIKQLNTNQEFAHYYQTIFRNANRLMSLINELMDFRKVESGVLKLNVKENNLILFVEEIIDEFKDLSLKKQLNFEIKDDFDYTNVWFDAKILEKIILNLLNNSFKYSGEDAQIKVSLMASLDNFTPAFANELILKESKRAKQYVYVKVADNGIGISKESIAHLFERYYRIASAHLGSGVGLAFVKSLTSLHKGDIYVYSERNEGTEIIIAIPANETSYTQAERAAAIEQEGGILFESNPVAFIPTLEENYEPKPQAVHTNQQTSILLVDDNPELRQFLVDTLQEDYRIYEAQDGIEGLEVARNMMPDLIISDVMMPRMDGIEFCKIVKNELETSHIPFVMLTAKEALTSKIEGVRSGADSYLAKPVSIDLLRLSIRNVFEQQQKVKDRYRKDYYVEARSLVNSNKDQEFMDKLHQILETNIENPALDVEFLCNEIGVSKTNLYQKIKTITGQSIAEFIRTFRLKKAVQLMLHEDILLAEITYRVGFQDPSYFSKVFKKEFGKTPSQFLEELG